MPAEHCQGSRFKGQEKDRVFLLFIKKKVDYLFFPANVRHLVVLVNHPCNANDFGLVWPVASKRYATSHGLLL